MKREKSAYLGMRFDYLYSIYVIFSSPALSSTHWIAWNAFRGRGSPEVRRARRWGAHLMPSYFTLCIIVLIALALFGLPIGLSMICASVFYLLIAGLDLGTAGEQILNGLFNSYVLLAVPLFILAADLMNSGSLTDRLLKFCLVLVGRFRGGLGHVNVVANIIFAGMSGSAIADAVGIGRIIIGMMTRNGKYPIEYAAAITASAAIIGPIIPPSIPMVVYALVSDTSIGYLFLGRSHTGAAARCRVHDHEHRDRPTQELSRRAAGSDAGDSAHHTGCVSRIDAAGRAAVRHLRRRDDTDGGRGGSGSVRAIGVFGTHIPVDLTEASCTRSCSPAPSQRRR